MGDVREYDGPLLRELSASSKSDIQIFKELAESSRYSRFLREKIVEAVLRCMDGGGRRDGLVERVLSDGIRLAIIGKPLSLESLNAAIRVDQEWVDFQKDRIVKVATMCDKELSEEDITKLMVFEGFDAIRVALESLDSTNAAPETTVAVDEDTDYETEGSGSTITEAADEVDETWLVDFEKAYGREAFVHEYVLLRRLDVPLTELYKTHFKMYQTITDIQRSYLDKHLTESEFVKKFVPAVLTDPGVCDLHLSDVLSSSDYHDNMCNRLQTVHRALYGEPMTQDESSYLFTKKVLAEKLTLQCERLNDIVMDFAKETEKLGDKVVEVYMSWLNRLPDSWEIKESLPLFREDVIKASSNLKETLVASLEFNDVLKRIIQDKAPEFTQAEVFRTLAKVLKRDDKTKFTPVEIVEKALSTV